MPANRPSAALAHISMDAQRTPAIDALRGCAVLCVVLLHIQIHMPQEQSLLGRILPQALFNIVFRSGYYGVIIFFVISGFLVTRSALERWGSLDAVPWRAFLLRRAARIHPCLLLLLIVLAALHGLDVPGFVIETTSLARATLAALGMHLNWLEARTGYLPAAWNVLWSLSVEEAFYLAFPLLCMLALATGERLLKLTLLLFVALGPFARVAFTDNEIWADHSYLSCLDGIAIGCLAALYSARARHVPTRLFMLCGGVLFVLVFFLRKATYGLGLTGAGLNVTALEIGSALLLIAWSRRRPSLEPPGLCLAFLRWMGVNSYEIYLTHMFPVMLLASVSCRNALAADGWCSAALSASAALAVLLSALLGSLVARYYSAPMRRWLTQLAGGLPRRRQARMRA
ncbi:acyltransferase [Achromobacter sp. Marseille-Q0513]|uniref:acyltransferase family protein n=1 Tax=Achromobacter sp. Marseille-Q0513 TaxID=2829161 RepID=UPI002011F1D0|nr:acyltransferase [Achromobacter sp. Marseille-Q0513]